MQLSDLEIFHVVAKLGSFTKAAESLGHSKAHVSRRVSALENDLKVKLLHRTTRTLHLTEAGQLCYNLAGTVSDTVKHQLEQLDSLRQHPQGQLKISVPPAFGEYVLAPLLPAFMQAYPDILLDIYHHTHLVDVIGEGFDIVLRRAILPDSNLIAQKLCEPKQLLVATPQCLKQHGPLESPATLQHYPCLSYEGQPQNHWRMMDHRLCQEVATPIKTVLRANTINTILSLTLAHQGAALLPDFIVKPYIKSGELIHCLPQIEALSFPAYLVYPSREHLPLKTQVMITFLQQHIH